MIIVEIGRGLGNSMFVYAAARALAENHGTELKLDTSYLQSWPQLEKYGGLWEFELGKFKISAKEASKREVFKHVIKTGFRPLDKIIFKYKLFEKNVRRFPTCGSTRDFFSIPDNTYLRGYLGNEKFFRKIKGEIKKEFELKNEYRAEIQEILNEVSRVNSVSIHVRRGDVLNLKDPNVLDSTYYENAIKIIKKKVKNPKFYVFSDDISWCRQNLKGLDENIVFVDNLPDAGYFVLEVMKNCKHNILANSALSWWSAYLNNNKKAIIVAPKAFTHFSSLKGNNPHENLMPSWITI